MKAETILNLTKKQPKVMDLSKKRSKAVDLSKKRPKVVNFSFQTNLSKTNSPSKSYAQILMTEDREVLQKLIINEDDLSLRLIVSGVQRPDVIDFIKNHLPFALWIETGCSQCLESNLVDS